MLQIMSKCWSAKPEERPTFESIEKAFKSLVPGQDLALVKNPPSTMPEQREVTDAENSGGIELGLLQVKDLYQIACPNQGGTVV